MPGRPDGCNSETKMKGLITISIVKGTQCVNAIFIFVIYTSLSCSNFFLRSNSDIKYVVYI